MDRAGEKLKRMRERLGLTYREVEQASLRIAERRGSEEFAIALSRLADIENKGTVPTIYRLYALSAIYGLDLHEVMRWYGVPVEQLSSDAAQVPSKETRAIQVLQNLPVTIPQPADLEIDLDKTTFLSHIVRRWGKASLSLLNGLDLRPYRYGFIGLDDWSMYPILQPGAILLIDQNRRKIAQSGWTNEFDRPIYFFEHRNGYLCGWSALRDKELVIQPHPSSQQQPSVFQFQTEIDVIGQVVGVAMRLESRKRRTPRQNR